MMGTYLALGRQWMRTILAIVDRYRVMLGVIGALDSREAG
jgi:hypothetical protein